MDKKTFSIGILSLMAVVLLVGNLLTSPRAEAVGMLNPGRDYQIVTAPIQSGGDALYVLDNRTGMLAVFTYDTNTRRMAPRVVTSASTCFAGPAAGTPGVAQPGLTNPRMR